MKTSIIKDFNEAFHDVDDAPGIFCISHRLSMPNPETGVIPSGGLASGVRAALEATGGGKWFGRAPALIQSPEERECISGLKGTPVTLAEEKKGIQFLTLPMTVEEDRMHYQHISNGLVWPLDHELSEYINQDIGAESVRGYKEVNRLYAVQAVSHIEPGAVVWPHDYQLRLVPKYLREQGVENPILFFNHIPVPSREFIDSPKVTAQQRALHDELIEGYFSCDAVGLQSMRDFRNLREYIGSDVPDPKPFQMVEMSYRGRTARFGVFPISIETADIERQSAEGARVYAKELAALDQDLNGRRMIIGVERLDFTKNLEGKAAAVDMLLQDHPEYRETVQFRQIAPLSREGLPNYQATIARVDAAMEGLRDRYAFGEGESPVRYIKKDAQREHLLGFIYRRAAVGLVTPLMDGMNLVAKEYVAAQDPANPGVLVLSKHAGAAEELAAGAILVDPRNKAEVADALRQALEMPLEERVERHQKMMNVLRYYDIKHWATSLVAQVSTPAAPESKPAVANENDPQVIRARQKKPGAGVK